jgi:hypothetical protein
VVLLPWTALVTNEFAVASAVRGACSEICGQRPRRPVDKGSCARGLAAGEELLQECAALRFEDAAAYVDAMVEPGIAHDIKE